jgi:nicotinamide mononucleotide transporter
MDWLAQHWLDLATALTGLLYIYLEYKAKIALWLVGIIMPAMSIVLYWQHGLYADFGMSIYYTLAAIYGYLVWKFGKKRGQKPKEEMPVTHYPLRLVAPATIVWLLCWAALWGILVKFTNSNVPITDSFVNSLSFIGLWALARKYLEQWLIWIVVDAVSAALYVYKGIPFMATLYGLYVVIAIFGYRKWRTMMVERAKAQTVTEGQQPKQG